MKSNMWKIEQFDDAMFVAVDKGVVFGGGVVVFALSRTERIKNKCC